MSKPEKRSLLGIAAALQQRRKVAELLLTAVILGVGVNLLASYILLDAQNRNAWMWALILLCISVPCIVIASAIAASTTVSTKVDALIVISRESKNPEQLPGYEFSESLARLLTTHFIDTPADSKLWRDTLAAPKASAKAPRSNGQGAFVVLQAPRMQFRQGKFEEIDLLLKEATQYYLLELLTSHIDRHFDQFHPAKDEVEAFSFKSLEQFASANRILAQLCKPIEELPGFRHEFPNWTTDNTFPVAMMGSASGRSYKKLNMLLPKGSTLTLLSTGDVLLKHPNLTVRLRPSSITSNKLLPRSFVRLMTGKSEDEFISLSMTVCLDSELTWYRLLFGANWDLYRWHDSLVSDLVSRVSFSNYLNEIGWSQAHTTLQVSNRSAELRRKRQQKSSSEAEL